MQITVSDRYVRPNEVIYATLYQSALQQEVSGFQAFLAFDSSVMSITPGDIALTRSPYGLHLLRTVSGASIELAAGINAFVGQRPTKQDAALAVLQFAAGVTEGITYVAFAQHDPPTRFTDEMGEEILPVMVGSPPIVIDGTPPAIDCPPDRYVNAPPGQWSTVVDAGAATATDWLSGVAEVSGIRSDGLPLADPYPVGGTTITWSAVDRSGNAAGCEQLVVVAPAGFHGAIVRSVAEAKKRPDGTQVTLLGPVVTRVFGPFFYIEDADRTAGIRANRVSGAEPTEASKPVVFGTVAAIAGERVVDEATVGQWSAGAVPGELSMNGAAAQEVLPQGLLARLWGRAEVQPGATDTFILWDGAEGGGACVRLYGAALPADGVYLTATGTLGADVGGVVLLVNRPGDLVQVVQ